MLEAISEYDEVLESVVKLTYDTDFQRFREYLKGQCARLERKSLILSGETMFRTQGCALCLDEIEEQIETSREVLQKENSLRETKKRL
jgi:hypothetical protein